MTTIKYNDTNETIYEAEDAQGMADALVIYFCDNTTPREVYDACVACADAYTAGEPTDAYEAYLGITID